MFARAARAAAAVLASQRDPTPGASGAQQPNPQPGGPELSAAEDGLRRQLEAQPLVASQYELDIRTTAAGRSATRRYLIAQACAGRGGGSESWRLAAEGSAETGTSIVPWGGVALPLPIGATAGAERAEPGQLFVFLPLPVASGLPCHVQGTFEVTSNRRELWGLTPDLVGAGRRRALYNSALLAELAAPLYAQLLAAAAPRLGPTPGYFGLWPEALAAARAKQPMAALVDPWLRCVAGAAVAYTQAGGGRWLPPDQAVFLDDRAAK